MAVSFIVSTEQELPAVARELLRCFPDNRVFAFYGEMGAGKTTFIKAICHELGVDNNTMSPTFAIINEYITRDMQSVYHMDFYRINSLEEVFDIGYEEYLFSGRFCLLEWPGLIEPLLPQDTVKVFISGETRREIRW
jgi:tRNA threonylcarbamoyladenosine biosynthesis protein TsaE